MMNCLKKKNLTFQRGPVLCPPQESLALNGRQSNCHSKYVVAHGWRRNRFGGIKVIMLGLRVVCFSVRGCSLGFCPVAPQTQEDHATRQQPLARRNAFQQPLTLCIEREMFWAEKRKRKKTQDNSKTGQIHPSQSMTKTVRKPSLYPPIPVSSWLG